MTRQYIQSIGMSCQTRHQLENFVRNTQAPKLDLITGMFDWLICPPSSFVRLLQDDFPPFTKDEITERNGRAYWTRYEFYFWHGFMIQGESGRTLDINSAFDAMAAKYAGQSAKFRTGPSKSTLFVFSNAQNNLSTEVFAPGHEALELGLSDLEAVQRALDNYFGHPCRMLFVTTGQRASQDVFLDPRTAFVEPDESEWKGNLSGWHQILSNLTE